jgi:hypothetical protein
VGYGKHLRQRGDFPFFFAQPPAGQVSTPEYLTTPQIFVISLWSTGSRLRKIEIPDYLDYPAT